MRYFNEKCCLLFYYITSMNLEVCNRFRIRSLLFQLQRTAVVLALCLSSLRRVSSISDNRLIYAIIDYETCDSLYSISTGSETGKQANATVLTPPFGPGKISTLISGKRHYDKQLTPAGKCQHISRQIAVDKGKKSKKYALCSTLRVEQRKSFIVLVDPDQMSCKVAFSYSFRGLENECVLSRCPAISFHRLTLLLLLWCVVT